MCLSSQWSLKFWKLGHDAAMCGISLGKIALLKSGFGKVCFGSSEIITVTTVKDVCLNNTLIMLLTVLLHQQSLHNEWRVLVCENWGHVLAQHRKTKFSKKLFVTGPWMSSCPEAFQVKRHLTLSSSHINCSADMQGINPPGFASECFLRCAKLEASPSFHVICLLSQCTMFAKAVINHSRFVAQWSKHTARTAFIQHCCLSVWL